MPNKIDFFMWYTTNTRQFVLLSLTPGLVFARASTLHPEKRFSKLRVFSVYYYYIIRKRISGLGSYPLISKVAGLACGGRKHYLYKSLRCLMSSANISILRMSYLSLFFAKFHLVQNERFARSFDSLPLYQKFNISLIVDSRQIEKGDFGSPTNISFRRNFV